MINIENRNKSLIIKDFLDNLKDEDIFISTLVEIKDSYYYVNNFGEEIFSKVLEELKISLGKCLKSYSFIYKEKKILLISKVDNSLRIRTQFKRIKRKFKRVNFTQNSSFNFSNLEFYIGITIAYARVSSHDQKADLERQKQVLEMYCASNGWNFEVLSDLGSGINYNKKGLKELIGSIIDGEVGRLVITHKDRLLRFGAELIFSICEAKEVEVVIINKGEDTTFEEDLAKDVLEIITVFSARLYGVRSKKNKKLIEEMQKAVDVSSQD